ncbi:uncharacterized protein LOC114363425 [Ostrinia furnacalis]|uniref:uncharacterized protein LOC114363425 n=1 Tax=Ostrinia furnacalis TaxID=93504 RepID=UPI00103AAB32|nr:uncharacterized protein LOC114363425 [Ostrinia furnacalis]
MSVIRSTLLIVVLLSLMASCDANFLEDIIGFMFGGKNKMRSMSEIITDFLDEVFPKDDKDTKAMKNIFTMYNEDGNNLFSSQYSGMDYLSED